MEKQERIYVLIAILALAAALLYPLVAYAIETSRVVEEAKLEQIAPTEKTATTSLPNLPEIPDSSKGIQAGTSGTASWYDYGLEGDPTYSETNAVAASRDYPRGTILRVTNTKTGAYVDVRVNDYGPEAWTGREIDLSSFAFSQIGNLRDGLARVEVAKVPDEK